jgi:hypothetical protein
MICDYGKVLGAAVVVHITLFRIFYTTHYTLSCDPAY